MARFSVLGEHMIRNAEVFATAAHCAIDQRRKYTGEPYIVHPAAVAELISREYVGVSWEMMCAAWLHDVVEDTKVTSDVISHLFGAGVGRMVDALTNPDSSAGTRRERHEMELKQIAGASWQAQTIRVADIIDNTKDIARLDPVFAERYLVEKAAVLDVLEHANPTLRTWAVNQVHRAMKELRCAA